MCNEKYKRGRSDKAKTHFLIPLREVFLLWYNSWGLLVAHDRSRDMIWKDLDGTQWKDATIKCKAIGRTYEDIIGYRWREKKHHGWSHRDRKADQGFQGKGQEESGGEYRGYVGGFSLIRVTIDVLPPSTIVGVEIMAIPVFYEDLQGSRILHWSKGLRQKQTLAEARQIRI